MGPVQCGGGGQSERLGPGSLTADQISQAGPENRMISWPYPKLMNSNNMVDQSAAVVLCSAEKADYLQIPREHLGFPARRNRRTRHLLIGERDELHRSPAIRIGGRRVLELAGVGVDDLDYVDLYSCFPSAVQVAARELRLPAGDPRRPLTVTGGLTFAGGPWNNYVTHSIATMADLLRSNPGSRGLITANGGYLTKHSFGVYSATPPQTNLPVARRPGRRGPAAHPHRPDGMGGVGTVESWTTPFDRDGTPEKAFLAVRTPEGARAMAVCR